ncbi:MAG: S41 family peptidase [Desulfobulbaceae bacterium]|nr:S41 family peptidase [Desulfobulbaceae bacterium]
MKRSIILLCTLFFLSTAAAADHDQDLQREETYKNLEVFSNVLTLLQEHYVDPIDSHEVITGAINGMLTSLDPHSSYLTPDDFKELQEETHGSFSGIGIEITLKDGILTVVSPIEDTPAYNAGIQAGDQIIRVDDNLTKDMTLMDVVKKLRGKKGTQVTISVFRAGWKDLRDFILTRDEIPVHSVKSMELEPGIFYVRISNFQSNTTRDFRKALQQQDDKQPVEGLILDLRNNPGGLLDQAVKISDVFLEEGVIVSTRGRDESQNMVLEAQVDDKQYTFPLIVMVNGGSASASEIVAGALQDHGRAIVLGTETFGKGSVQTIVPMPDGAGLRLTTARYYTPSGDSIQAKGIKPDIMVELLPPRTDDEVRQKEHSLIREKDLPNHFTGDEKKKGKSFFGSDEEEEGDGKKSEVAERLRLDNQLRTALFIMKSLRIANTPLQSGDQEQ